jgi:hypothetical protein
VKTSFLETIPAHDDSKNTASSVVDREVAEQFVRENWLVLAASAWRFQLYYGPGALIVEWAVVERWSKSPDSSFQPRYATRTENAGFNAVIAGYDPRTAIVVAFSDERLTAKPADRISRLPPPIVFRAGTALAAMTFSAEPSPPNAHRASGN